MTQQKVINALLLLSITKYSYFEIFIALGLGIVGLPVPDETLMAYAGFLVFQGKLNYLYTILVAFTGTSCGITIGYVIGKTFGNPGNKNIYSYQYLDCCDYFCHFLFCSLFRNSNVRISW